MLWRTELPEDVEAADVVARMLTAGWVASNPNSFVHTIQDPHGHILVIVPRTRRVQIRLDFETPKPTRALTARAIHRTLMQFCLAG